MVVLSKFITSLQIIVISYILRVFEKKSTECLRLQQKSRRRCARRLLVFFTTWSLVDCTILTSFLNHQIRMTQDSTRHRLSEIPTIKQALNNSVENLESQSMAGISTVISDNTMLTVFSLQLQASGDIRSLISSTRQDIAEQWKAKSQWARLNDAKSRNQAAIID